MIVANEYFVVTSESFLFPLSWDNSNVTEKQGSGEISLFVLVCSIIYCNIPGDFF